MTLKPTSANFISGHRYFGVRFELGLIPKFLNIRAGLLVNQMVDLLYLVPAATEVFEKIVDQTSCFNRALLLKKFLCLQPEHKPSPLTSHVLALICNSQGSIRSRELELHTGYTRRTLFRQFISDIGVSPKMFGRIIRCQLAISDIDNQHEIRLSSLVQNLGFNDQSHFQHEFKKMVSVTPCEYKSQTNQNAYLGRIRYS